MLKDCPEKVQIKRSIIKRITNNFISNSLKHTMSGTITITVSILSAYQILSNTFDWIHVGTDLKMENT